MNSKQTFENIRDLIKANYPLIYAVTTEYNRSLSYIRDLSMKNGYKFQVWDCVTGLQEHKKVDKNIEFQEVAGCQDYIGLLDYIIKTTDEKETQSDKEIFLIEDLHRYFDQVETFTRLRKLAEKLRFYDKHIILTGPFIKIPDELEKFVTVVNIPLPDRKDLEKNLDYISRGEKIDDDLKKHFIDSALGMTDMEAFLAFQLAKQKVGLQTKRCCSNYLNGKRADNKEEWNFRLLPSQSGFRKQFRRFRKFERLVDQKRKIISEKSKRLWFARTERDSSCWCPRLR